MVSATAVTLDNRQHGAYLLAERLHEYRDDDTVIVAIPRGGMVTGYHLSQLMRLPLEVTCCLRIKHPGDRTKTIGSVSQDEIIVHEGDHDLPQDYVYRQIMQLKQQARDEVAYYSQDRLSISLKNKTVIVTDDFVKTGDTMLACLKSIAKQKPKKLVVATPLITAEAMHAIIGFVDDVIFVNFFSQEQDPKKIYSDFRPVTDEEARALYIKARQSSFARKLEDELALK